MRKWTTVATVAALVMAVTIPLMAQGGKDDHKPKKDKTDKAEPVSVPEPGTLLLIGTGLAGSMAFLRRRRR
jgi:hypothetical protein